MACYKNCDCEDKNGLEETLLLAEKHSDELQKLLNEYKLTTNYYKEEAAKMELALRSTQLLDNECELIEVCQSALNKLTDLRKKYELKEVTPNSVALTYVNKRRKSNHYATKLKMCLKMYLELNESLSKRIKYLKEQYNKAENSINNIYTLTLDEVKAIEKKIDRYEHTLTNLEKRYPWLNEQDLDLPNISKMMGHVRSSRKEKEALLKELDTFSGLKPDLEDASRQLHDIKKEYQELNHNMLKKN